MPQHVFFSWQSDTPSGVGRSFVESCLKGAIGELLADADVDLADRELGIDKDTLNEPGSPPIADTIFAKIDRAAVFLADMTYVAVRPDGGRSPNPNVLVEHGWALKSLGHRRVLAVMNTAYGDPDRDPLPFDLRHARWPIRYLLSEESDAATRKNVKEGLVRGLKEALKAILSDSAVQATLRPPRPEEVHPRDVRLLRQIRKLITEKALLFLRDHNFGATLHRSQMEPFYEIWARWRGAGFEFHDAEVQKKFAEMLQRNAEFSELANGSLHIFGTNERALTIKTDYDLSHGTQDRTIAVAKDLNDKASALVTAIDAFERIARDRIREADEEETLDEKQIELAQLWIQQLAGDGIKGGYAEIVPMPRLSLRVAPLAATVARRLDPRVGTAVQRQFPYSDQEAIKADTDGNQWWVCAQPLRGDKPNPETAWRMRLVRPGNFEFQYNIGQRIDDDPHIVVDGLELERTIVGNLDRMLAFARELGFEGGAVISIGFEGMEDVELRQGRRRFGRPEIALPLVTVSDIGEPVASAVQEQLDMLWQMVGQGDGSPSFTEGRWRGYERG